MVETDMDVYRELLAAVEADDKRVGVVSSIDPKPIQDNLTVAYVIARNPLQGGEYYRATRPAALANRGYGWHTLVAEQIGIMDGSKTKRVACQAYGSEHVVEPDVLIIRPLGREEKGTRWTLKETIDTAHAAGQIVLADLDDDLWGHEDFPDGAQPEDIDDKYETWCWDVDGWLASTPYMADRIREVGKRRGHSPKVVVAPNCYDPIGLGINSHPRAGRRLGTRLWLHGRMVDDLSIYAECFTPLLEALDCTFTHIGHTEPKELVQWAQYRARSFVNDCGMPEHRVFTLPSCTVPELGKLMGDHISIACIAMADHPFNYAKTETHAMEVASAGLPIVAATTLSIYDKVPGRVAPTPKAVRQRVERLLDKDVWRWESDKARTWAKKVAVRSEALHLRALQDLINELVK